MRKVKPYTVSQAQALVRDARTRTSRLHKRWDSLEQLYYGGAITGTDNDDTGTFDWFDNLPTDTVNFILPHINLLIESAVDRDPRFGVEPVGYGDSINDEQETLAASVAEQTIQYWFRRCNGRHIIQLL